MTAASVLLRFASRMSAKLDANEHKGGWEECTVEYLLIRLKQEVRELDGVFKSVEDGGIYWTDFPFNMLTVDERARVASEAADVANFALMIADRCAGRQL